MTTGGDDGRRPLFARWDFSVGRRGLMLAAAGGLAGSLLPGAALARGTARHVRIGRHGDVTRFVLEMSHDVGFRVFTLADPPRAVIDLPEVDWGLSRDSLPAATGSVQSMRFGLFSRGVSRVVLDLTGPAAIDKAFVLPPQSGFPVRLVLDLRRTSDAAFRAGAGKITEVGQRAPFQPGDARPDRQPVPEPAPRRNGEKPLIVLDAGHGGIDPGAIGVGGIYEKNVTLAMARELRDMLIATGRYRVSLTRDRDVYLRLRERVAHVRKVGGDLFISLHADSIKSPSVRGLSVYTLSETASDKEAALLAEKENKADIIAGVDLSDEAPEVTDILIDLAQREAMNLSAQYAALLIEDVGQKVQLLRNTHRFAGFAVLKAPDVPSVLLEMGYLSNDYEARLLQQRSYRAKLARAVISSADRYFA